MNDTLYHISMRVENAMGTGIYRTHEPDAMDYLFYGAAIAFAVFIGLTVLFVIAGYLTTRKKSS